MSDAITDGERLDGFLAAIADLELLIAERDKRDGFNIFEVMGVVNAEIRHSNTIAWLMDPQGGHGLGGRVLAGLIEHAEGTPPKNMGGFSIKREADHIDILAVSSKDRMTLAVENKVWSGEHDDQLGRYRRVIEKKYPGWEHLYLYLTPNDDAPESREDAAIWTTLGYGDLVEIVSASMEGVGLPEKARNVVEDYLECIRRHILGDDELRERCVEIYAEHKRAIDLIVESLPDARKTVHDFVRKWAEGLDGAYVVKECSGGKSYVRFRTNRVDELFPPIDAKDSWNQNSFWFYELITRQTSDGLGCGLQLQLCFNNPKKVTLPEERANAAAAFLEAFADGDGGMFSITSYSGYYTDAVRIDSESIAYEDVADICEALWKSFLVREERAVRQLLG